MINTNMNSINNSIFEIENLLYLNNFIEMYKGQNANLRI